MLVFPHIKGTTMHTDAGKNKLDVGQLDDDLAELSDWDLPFDDPNMMKLYFLRSLEFTNRCDAWQEFQDLDENGDGVISFDEFFKMKARTKQFIMEQKPKIRKLFNDIDLDKNGVLEFEEFVSYKMNIAAYEMMAWRVGQRLNHFHEAIEEEDDPNKHHKFDKVKKHLVMQVQEGIDVKLNTLTSYVDQVRDLS